MFVSIELFRIPTFALNSERTVLMNSLASLQIPVVGTEKGMTQTFGSTCHGAGRALSRNQSRKKLDHNQVLEQLHKNGISIRVASPKLVTEEAPESYKNVCDVIDTCQDAGISRKVVKLRPIAVIKG